MKTLNHALIHEMDSNRFLWVKAHEQALSIFRGSSGQVPKKGCIVL